MAGRKTARAGGAAAFCGLVTSAAVSAAALPAAPIQWAVKIGPGECMLDGGGITDPIPVGVSLQTIVGSDSYRFAIVGHDVPRTSTTDPFPVTLQFHQADRALNQQATGAHVGARGEAILVRGAGPELLDAIAHSTSFGMIVKSKTLGPFALPQAKGAIAAFLGCERDQLVEWGADPAQFQPGGKRPVALKSRDAWLTNSQLVQLPEGAGDFNATFQVAIAVDGKIDGCKRIDPDAKGGAERKACDVLRGQKLFTPASDAAGKPVRGIATFDVHLFSRPNMR